METTRPGVGKTYLRPSNRSENLYARVRDLETAFRGIPAGDAFVPPVASDRVHYPVETNTMTKSRSRSARPSNCLPQFPTRITVDRLPQRQEPIVEQELTTTVDALPRASWWFRGGHSSAIGSI